MMIGSLFMRLLSVLLVVIAVSPVAVARAATVEEIALMNRADRQKFSSRAPRKKAR